MNHVQIEASIQNLNQLVLEGKILDAFDSFYHEDVTMQENDLAPTLGKELNREREIQFMENIVEFRSAAVKGIYAAENFSVVIWSYDYTHKEWGVRNYTQANVQQWKDGKIISEKFIYTD
jgi:hypothetical protein